MRAVLYKKKKIRKTFVQNVMVRLEWIRTNKNADKKNILFQGEANTYENRKKADEKRKLCKSNFRIILLKTSH